MATKIAGHVELHVDQIDPKDLREALDTFLNRMCHGSNCPSLRDRNSEDYAALIKECPAYKLFSKQTGTKIGEPEGEGQIRFVHVDCPFYDDDIYVK